jgi:hypothetical protein
LTVAPAATAPSDAVETFDPRTPADRFARAKGELAAQDAIMRKRLTADQYNAWRTAEDQRLADVAAIEAKEAADAAAANNSTTASTTAGTTAGTTT